MLTVEQKNTIKKCYDSYAGWGEESAIWFTCQIMLETTDYKDLPFCDVFGFIWHLYEERFKAFQKRTMKEAEEKEKLKKAEEKKNGQSKRSRKLQEDVCGDANSNEPQRNQ